MNNNYAKLVAEALRGKFTRDSLQSLYTDVQLYIPDCPYWLNPDIYTNNDTMTKHILEASDIQVIYLCYVMNRSHMSEFDNVKIACWHKGVQCRYNKDLYNTFTNQVELESLTNQIIVLNEQLQRTRSELAQEQLKNSNYTYEIARLNEQLQRARSELAQERQKNTTPVQSRANDTQQYDYRAIYDSQLFVWTPRDAEIYRTVVKLQYSDDNNLMRNIIDVMDRRSMATYLSTMIKNIDLKGYKESMNKFVSIVLDPNNQFSSDVVAPLRAAITPRN